jgi:hypothetical protein
MIADILIDNDAPAAALLTGLAAGEWSPLRSPYAFNS